jgi:hypothetical protein
MITMKQRVEPRSRNRIVILLVSAAALILAYWILWYTARGVIASDNTDVYVAFENAFPAADAWLVVCLIGAAVTLVRRRPTALFWLLAGGGAGLYLFAMDSLYDVEHQVWWTSGSGGCIELAINLLTLGMGVGLLRWAWHHRGALLAGDG